MGDTQAMQRAADNLARLITEATRKLPMMGVPTLEEDPDPDDPAPLWKFWDGRLRGRDATGAIVEYALAGTPGPSTSTVAAPADPAPVSDRLEYPTLWGRSFCDVHGAETGAELGYGYSTDHGRRRIMLGFDAAQIASDLAGATVATVEISAVNTAAWADTVRIHWGGHDQPAAPAAYSGVRRDVWSDTWPRSGGGDWRPAHPWIGRAFRDGDIAGLLIDQGPGQAESGALRWESVRLAVEYTI